LKHPARAAGGKGGNAMARKFATALVTSLLTVLGLALLWNGGLPPRAAAADEARLTAQKPNGDAPKDAPTRAEADPDARRVLVVYRSNTDDFNKNGVGDSEEIARYYAKRRGIPDENLLGIKVDLPFMDVYSKATIWPFLSFQVQLLQPLRKKLTALGPDKILYIVTCFGMPERVEMPPSKKQVSADAALGSPFTIRDDGFHTRGFYSAPDNATRYKADRFSTRRALWTGTDAMDNITYLVSRLDGMGVPNCEALVDGAIYANTYNVDGYGYLDTRFGTYTDDDLRTWLKQPTYYPNDAVDKGIGSIRLFMDEAGIKVRQQPEGDVIGATDKLKYTDGTSAAAAPRALMYAGWYNYVEYRNVFDWLPGSVAIDFDSASLFAPRMAINSFGSMALMNGASGSVGCFDEPYTTGHPRPDVFFNYYLRGYNFAEAAWLSQPIEVYVNYAIGDPLLRPYGHKRTVDTRLETPKVTWTKDGNMIRAEVQMPGEVEIARGRLIVAAKKDDILLPACNRRDGLFRRELSLGAPLPKGGPSFAGLVLTDPAGNTLRLWNEL
jgi:uncharacterized protein (TIGR03790 family)